jgi:hypothetical protein
MYVMHSPRSEIHLLIPSHQKHPFGFVSSTEMRVHACMYVYIRVYIHISSYSTNVCRYTYVYMYVCMYACIHGMYAYFAACMLEVIHTQIRMHAFHLRKRSALAGVDKVARFHTCVRLLHCPISSWARGGVERGERETDKESERLKSRRGRVHARPCSEAVETQ